MIQFDMHNTENGHQKINVFSAINMSPSSVDVYNLGFVYLYSFQFCRRLSFTQSFWLIDVILGAPNTQTSIQQNNKDHTSRGSA